MKIVMPKSWTQLTASKATRKTQTASTVKVQHRNPVYAMDMSEDVAGRGLCPVTKQPMVPMFANGHPVLVGMESKIVLPVKD